MCGENSHTPVTTVFAPGSSPRVRGKLETFRPDQFTLRLIPACAGKTLALFVMRSHVRAHPRVCGENWAAGPLGLFVEGSSPRVRGKRFACLFLPSCSGLIPACAGKTPTKHATKSSNKAHPRVCGENTTGSNAALGTVGSSPRVRGKRPPAKRVHARPGLIPACAGKTDPHGYSRLSVAAHPRVCGENAAPAAPASLSPGSSPRVRGKLFVENSRRLLFGLIPACAGKTRNAVILPSRSRAHPRVCGENGLCRFSSIMA